MKIIFGREIAIFLTWTGVIFFAMYQPQMATFLFQKRCLKAESSPRNKWWGASIRDVPLRETLG